MEEFTIAERLDDLNPVAWDWFQSLGKQAFRAVSSVPFAKKPADSYIGEARKGYGDKWPS